MRIKFLIASLFCLIFVSACEVLTGLVPNQSILDKISSDQLLKEKPPISTSFKTDAITEVHLLDKFNPAKSQFKDANTLPRTPNGSYVLQEGLYFLNANSFCMKAGTYGPSQGDGYVYASLRGKKDNIIRKLIEGSYDNKSIGQKEVQELIWALIARKKFSEMPEARKRTARKLLNQREIMQLNGGLWAMVPPEVKKMAFAKVAPGLGKILQVEQQMRGLLSSSTATYRQLEQAAVLTGKPTWGEDVRPTPPGRWSYNPKGFFIRFFSNHYSKTRVEIYVPNDIKIERENQDRINRIELNSKLTLSFNYAKGFVEISRKSDNSSSTESCQLPFNPTSKSSQVDAFLRKFNIKISTQEYTDLLNLHQIAKKMDQLSCQQKGTEKAFRQSINESLASYMQQLLVGRYDVAKRTNILAEVRRINELKFGKSKESEYSHQVWDPIETVAAPAKTSKQRLVLSPAPIPDTVAIMVQNDDVDHQVTGNSNNGTGNQTPIPPDAISVSNKEVTVKIWDDLREDGDTVSVFLNGIPIEENVRVKKAGQTFSLNLESGQNTFRLYAHNIGEISPNTAAILVSDGKKEHRRTLSSKADEFAEISILVGD